MEGVLSSSILLLLNATPGTLGFFLVEDCMVGEDKIEAVSKLSETAKTEGSKAEEMERMAPNKDHFDSLMNAQSSVKSPSLEQINAQASQVEPAENLEKNPIVREDNVTSQQSGSSSDQQQKRGNQNGGIEEISEVRGKQRSPGPGSSNALMDEVSKLNSQVGDMTRQGPEAIKKQSQDAIKKLDDIKDQLSSSKTEIKPSYHTILKNRLSHIDDAIKVALNKAGIEEVPPASKPSRSANPLRKFINMMTDSQRQLEQLNTNIESISHSKGVSPAQMMAIQMKMNFVTQQLELFSNMLNKALESTKTIMNVQV